jgi:hypothetical protein
MYTFFVSSDAGVRLWVYADGQDREIIDWWGPGAGEKISTAVWLEAGIWHKIMLWYNHPSGNAYVQLSWASDLQVVLHRNILIQHTKVRDYHFLYSNQANLS